MTTRRYRGIDPEEDTESQSRCVIFCLGSKVTGESIRKRILKGASYQLVCPVAGCYRGIDPEEDTESAYPEGNPKRS